MAPDINKVRIGLGVQAGLAQGLGKITGIPLLNQIAGSTHNGQCTLACGLRQLLNSFGPQILDRYPVHTLEQSLATRVLKSMTVKENGIALGFGI